MPTKSLLIPLNDHITYQVLRQLEKEVRLGNGVVRHELRNLQFQMGALE